MITHVIELGNHVVPAAYKAGWLDSPHEWQISYGMEWLGCTVHTTGTGGNWTFRDGATVYMSVLYGVSGVDTAGVTALQSIGLPVI